MNEVNIDGTVEEYEKSIKETTGPLIVYFSAPWCGPCRVFGPIVEKAGLPVVKINTDKYQEIAAKAEIRSVPTVQLYQDGVLKKERSGVMQESAFSKWVTE